MVKLLEKFSPPSVQEHHQQAEAEGSSTAGCSSSLANVEPPKMDVGQNGRPLMGPQMWMSSLVLTIHNFGVPNFDPYPKFVVFSGTENPGHLQFWRLTSWLRKPGISGGNS